MMKRKLVKILISYKFKTSGRGIFFNHTCFLSAHRRFKSYSDHPLLIACPSVCERFTFFTSLKSLAHIYPTFKVCTKHPYGKGVVKIKNRKRNPFQREDNHK